MQNEKKWIANINLKSYILKDINRVCGQKIKRSTDKKEATDKEELTDKKNLQIYLTYHH